MTEYRIVRRHELCTRAWSGGTTTQLAIWPRGAIYEERNFAWRVSSARVDDEESEFTPLPGVSRILMVLEGRLEMEHVGHHAVTLCPYGQDSFDGAWTTKSRGCVTDFNVMVTDGKASAEKIDIPAAGGVELCAHPATGRWKYLSEVVYVLADGVEAVMPDGSRHDVGRGDVVMVTVAGADGCQSLRLSTRSGNDAVAVVARIAHN